MEEKERLITSLQIIDPLLQFLTKATGRTIVPLNSIQSIIPNEKRIVIQDIPHLFYRGVLHVEGVSASAVDNDDEDDGDDDDDTNVPSSSFQSMFTTIDPQNKIMIGFPMPMNHFASGGSNTNTNTNTNTNNNDNSKKVGLHGSTKTAGKRRLAALKRSFKKGTSKAKDKHKGKDKSKEKKSLEQDENKASKPGANTETEAEIIKVSRGLDPNLMNGMIHNEKYAQYTVKEKHGKIKNGSQGGGGGGGGGLDTTNPTTIDDAIMGDHKGKSALMSLKRLLDRDDDDDDDDNINNGHNDSQVKEASVTGNIGTIQQRTSSKEAIQNKSFIMPRQAAHAGSQQERPLRNKFLSKEIGQMIPSVLSHAMGLQLTDDESTTHSTSTTNDNENKNTRRKLYLHQAKAIESVLKLKHTLVCTGTGSGKSLCFLLPILATVMNNDINDTSNSSTGTNNINDDIEKELSNENNSTSALIMFPTKALAQDQLSKLETLLRTFPQLGTHIRPGIIDGDTPHQNRAAIADNCNIILSNPDTLHAAILPGWKGIYRQLLTKLQYVVIDELHSYEGAFGAHVSLVLSRLSRVCRVANFTGGEMYTKKKLVFVGCSATIGHPDEHFRLICPIASQDEVNVITAEDDGSRCAAKHFFVWNPSLLDANGDCIGRVTLPPRKSSNDSNNGTSLSTSMSNSNPTSTSTNQRKRWRQQKRKRGWSRNTESSINNDMSLSNASHTTGEGPGLIKRTHAADETARLLAHLVKMRVRSIAFCKTRSLAEWVYERCISILKSTTEDMASLVEIYRGGYSAASRRIIEGRLFRNEVYGVVGTSALELGVDIGGIDVTLHCGYPGSISSVLQQAGRAGRGSTADRPSYSIMVCFSSPSEQHLWKHPKGLLGRGLSAPPAVPLNVGIVSGHLLCASEEFPLVGSHSVTSILSAGQSNNNDNLTLSDHDLFGCEETYREAFESILDRKQIRLEKVNDHTEIETYSNHPSIQKPSLNVSLRSIEPINYSIVDLNHPGQEGTQLICKEAVLDNIPYSRVFYHAYPGAIIIHRGRRYKIQSMNSPPAFVNCNTRYRFNSCNLGAFAKLTNAKYSTNALSITLITIVKQLQRIEIPQPTEKEKKNSDEEDKNKFKFEPELSLGSLAGNGVVTVKRTVHGYKKLSLVNRVELSRSEISLPPMEYDTNALWIDTEASVLAELMPDSYDKGVHALSHAIVAVAPLFVPCNSSDLDCDHTHYGCTRVLLFDVRAGGAGTCNLLYRFFFHPDGVLKAAIDLLSECPLECDVGHYKGGCPGCIQAVPCINFQQDLSRNAGLLIARRMLARIEKTALYQENCIAVNNNNNNTNKEGEKTNKAVVSPNSSPSSHVNTPRKRLRQKRLDMAANLVSARRRNIVVGRQTWPTDHASSRFNTTVEDIEAANISANAPVLPGGGFID